MKIGFSKISDSVGYQLYVQWLQSAGIPFEPVNLFGLPLSDAVAALEQCDGLVLTGGADVHPSRYGRPDEEKRCFTNPARDELDYALIERALSLRAPMLAICRGCQVLNASRGGTLIVDIASDFGTAIQHNSSLESPAYHAVSIDPGSLLHRIGNETSSHVASVHHQAIDRLGGCFRAVARASDGIVEAYEWVGAEEKSFLLALQWHPEIGFADNKFSRDIAAAFLNAAYNFGASRSAGSNRTSD